MRREPFSDDWIAWQSGLRPGDPSFVSKVKLVRDFAELLASRGEKITYGRIRAMLDSVGRGYGPDTSRQEIHQGLQHARIRRQLPLRPNGRRVRVGDRVYRSMREAARAERCRQSAVRDRIERGEPGWSFVD
ncbi:MAG TPA: hypothetical protein VI669_12690 [Vicinamibacteria bacterium]